MLLPSETASTGVGGGRKIARIGYTDQLRATLPEQMLGKRLWLLWKSESVMNGVKPRKIPYYVDGDARGTDKASRGRFSLDTPQDVAKLATFEAAAAAFDAAGGRYNGLGFAVIEGCGIGSIDLDNCLSSDGCFTDAEAERVVEVAQRCGCYVEVSPSTTGVRIFGHTVGFNSVTHNGFEAYASKRFLTVTANLLSGSKAWGDIDETAELLQRFVNAKRKLSAACSVAGGLVTNAERVTAINADIIAHAVYQTPTFIPKGSRNAALLAHAGHLRGRGLSEDQILEKVREFNRAVCEEPVDDEEVVDIVGRYAQPGRVGGGAAVPRRSETFNDAGNADRFVSKYAGSVIWVPELRRWYVWSDGHWRSDSHGRLIEFATGVARGVFREAAEEDDNTVRNSIVRWANKGLDLPRLEAMLTLAKPRLSVSVNDLDSDDMLLGVPNGVVDLRHGKLRRASPEDFITRIAPVPFDPKATCHVWETAIKAWVGVEPDMPGFLQRIAGYTLTGSTVEQCFFFLHGSGRNGKSVFVNTLRELLGPHTVQSQPEVLMVQRYSNPSGPTPEIARLAGVRLVTMVETEDGQRMAEARVKGMTGGDAVTARTHRAEPFDFVPKFKLLLAGNHRPIIGGDDTGIWRRVVLVPFTVEIPPNQVDRRLPEKLRAELPGILRWAVEGCREWQRIGLSVPKSVSDAVKAYRTDMDMVERFIEEECDVGEKENCRARELYEAYSQWAQGGGFRPVSEVRFANKMDEHGRRMGFSRAKGNRGVVYNGVSPRRVAAWCGR
jgi:putative DNA primase/helicase